MCFIRNALQSRKFKKCMIIFTYAYALHMCIQWWLMTVTCGGAASSNQTFIKTKLHHVFHNGVDCYYA